MRVKVATCKHWAVSCLVHALVIGGVVAWQVRKAHEPKEVVIPLDVALMQEQMPMPQRVEAVPIVSPAAWENEAVLNLPTAEWRAVETVTEPSTAFAPNATYTWQDLPPPPSPPEMVVAPTRVEGRADEIALRVKPKYPRRERERGIQGISAVQVVVAISGEVLTTELTTSSGSNALDAAALEAARRTEFRQGEASERVFHLEFEFVIIEE